MVGGRLHNAIVSCQSRLTIYAVLTCRFMATDNLLVEIAFMVYAPALSQFRALLMAASCGYHHLLSSLSKYMYMVPFWVPAGLIQRLRLKDFRYPQVTVQLITFLSHTPCASAKALMRSSSQPDCTPSAAWPILPSCEKKQPISATEYCTQPRELSHMARHSLSVLF